MYIVLSLLIGLLFVYVFCHFQITLIITSLGKEVMLWVVLVCLYVCLSVRSITENVINGLQWNFTGGPGWGGGGKRNNDEILVGMWIFLGE